MSVAQNLDLASLEKLRETFRGRLIVPGDGDYDRSRVGRCALPEAYPRCSASQMWRR